MLNNRFTYVYIWNTWQGEKIKELSGTKVEQRNKNCILKNHLKN